MDVFIPDHAVLRFQERIAPLGWDDARQAIRDGCAAPYSVTTGIDPRTGRQRWMLRVRREHFFIAVVVASPLPDHLPAVVTVKHGTRGYSQGAGRPRNQYSATA